MNKSDELRMTHSGIITQKGQKTVHISFERGNDFAEATLPSGSIEKSSGFTPEELEQLKQYLLQNSEDIMNRAKKVNPLRSWMKKE